MSFPYATSVDRKLNRWTTSTISLHESQSLEDYISKMTKVNRKESFKMDIPCPDETSFDDTNNEEEGDDEQMWVADTITQLQNILKDKLNIQHDTLIESASFCSDCITIYFIYNE
jgi:hypothetical protein